MLVNLNNNSEIEEETPEEYYFNQVKIEMEHLKVVSDLLIKADNLHNMPDKTNKEKLKTIKSLEGKFNVIIKKINSHMEHIADHIGRRIEEHSKKLT